MVAAIVSNKTAAQRIPIPTDGVEQQPVDQNRQSHGGRHIGLHADHVDGPQAEGEHSSQEQEYDPKYVQGAVLRIAVIFHVI